jgi:hypothetical protein
LDKSVRLDCNNGDGHSGNRDVRDLGQIALFTLHPVGEKRSDISHFISNHKLDRYRLSHGAKMNGMCLDGQRTLGIDVKRYSVAHAFTPQKQLIEFSWKQTGGIMKSSYFFAAMTAALTLTGCGTSHPRYATADPEVIVVGDQPPGGYPTSSIVHYGNFCAQVSETWVPSVDPASGTKIWLKQVTRVAAACQ